MCRWLLRCGTSNDQTTPVKFSSVQCLESAMRLAVSWIVAAPDSAELVSTSTADEASPDALDAPKRADRRAPRPRETASRPEPSPPRPEPSPTPAPAPAPLCKSQCADVARACKKNCKKTISSRKEAHPCQVACEAVEKDCKSRARC